MAEELPSDRRSKQVRSRNRRALAWSILIAAVLHGIVFLLSPTWETKPGDGWTAEVQSEEPPPEFEIPVLVRVHFGPPAIEASDGTFQREPADRMLEAEHVIRFPEECREPVEATGRLPSGSVRLRLDWRGRVTTAAVEESAGYACGDELIRSVAEALWYRWLPSERYPAPVELVQPVALRAFRS